MNKYRLILNAEEVKKILDILFDRPFKEVYELIGRINEQLVEQEEYNAESDDEEED
ncbi:MAG TPA: hypothetical protein PLR24_00905 [Saprospiraceae bacterium]|nr:hypothetical protein [Saprospiraceae bacterium]